MADKAPSRFSLPSLCRTEEATYAALRMVAGAMLSLHGVQKVLGWLAVKSPPPVGSQLWLGGVIELATGVLIALGLLTRPAALLASGTMAVAYFQYHFKLDFSAWHWLPLVNKGELAALYCFVFLFIAARGPGSGALSRRGRS